MSREELISELTRAQTEIQTLQATIHIYQEDCATRAAAEEEKRRNVQQSLGLHSTAALPANGAPRYDVSFNVLLVTGGLPHRTRNVPLGMLLDRSYGREDLRESDTPVYGTGGSGLFGGPGGSMGRQPSVNQFAQSGEGLIGLMGRSSTGSFVMDSPEGQQPRFSGGSVASASGNSPQTAIDRAGKPTPLMRLSQQSLRLDADSIVSKHTLYSFNQLYSRRPLTPQSSAASSMWRYLKESFRDRNHYAHGSEAEAFARVLLTLCGEVTTLLQEEPFHVPVSSPAYVFGDIHGNFKDLDYFCSTIVNFDDLRFSPYHLLFLGDYVDRGQFNVECVAYLFTLKVLAPKRVTLLRGNHEDTLVNGDTRTYGETSLKGQCLALFPGPLGAEVWERINKVFTQMPLTANIDKAIFCTHGGLPRYEGGNDDRMELLMNDKFPRFDSFFVIPERESDFNRRCRQVACDVCWSDPADDDGMTNHHGFGPNPRGNGVILFGSNAVDAFLQRYGFEYIFRAHQEKSDGLKVSKNARVITIFSTSAYVGHQNGAGIVYVADGRIRLIVKEADDAPPEGTSP